MIKCIVLASFEVFKLLLVQMIVSLAKLITLPNLALCRVALTFRVLCWMALCSVSCYAGAHPTTSRVGSLKVAAAVGAALNFDGVDDYVRLGTSSALKPTAALTLELWAYRADWTNIMPTNTVNKRMASVAEQGGFALFVNQQGGNTIQGLVRRNGVYGSVSTPASTLASGWHHFALTYDGRYTTLYVDGISVATDDAGGSFPIEYSTTTNNFLVGAEASTGNTAESNSYFQGSIDEVRIWNIARASSEIAANRNCELTGTEVGLAGYYTFNQGIASGTNTGVTSLTNAVASGQNGTLVNFALTGSGSNWIEPGGVVSGVVCSPSPTPWAINLQTSGSLSSQNCSVRITGLGYGESFVFTGPQGYVFSNVFRELAPKAIVVDGIKTAGTYLLTVRLGSQVVTYNVEVTGTGCN